MFARSLAILAILAAAPVAWSQTPADSTVTFGNKLSVATLASALQGNGYQALITKPPNLTNQFLGVIGTGINGIRVSILVGKCPNTTTDEICTLAITTSYNDDKNLINSDNLVKMTSAMGFAKAFAGKRPDGATTFNLMYVYMCRGLDDPKVVNYLLTDFGVDVAKALQLYNAGFVTPPAAAPDPAAK